MGLCISCTNLREDTFTNCIKPSVISNKTPDNPNSIKEKNNPSSSSVNKANTQGSAAMTNNQNNDENPYSNFERLMLNEINFARANPSKFAEKLNNLIPMIHTNNNGKTFLIYDDDIKIELKRGMPAFKSCINYLNDFKGDLQPIQFMNELCIPFPTENPQLIRDRHYIGKCIQDIKNSLDGRCEIYDFQYDISPNPILSTLIQVVDDTDANLQRRDNILSDSIKYVGISYGEVKKGIYCFYLLFGC